MRFIIISVLLAVFIFNGCSNVKTYTFEKERVDQKRVGNRGYIIGDPPPAPPMKETPTRTMIGVDIEVPVLPGEKAELEPEEKPVYEEETVVYEEETVIYDEPETPAPQETEMTNFEPKEKTDTSTMRQEEGEIVIEEDIVEEEEQWIK